MAEAADTIIDERNTAATCLRDRAIRLALPIHRYWAMWQRQPWSFLLDSARVDPRLGRFSFVGGDPAAVFSIRRQPNHTPDMPAKITVTQFRHRGGPSIEPPARHTFLAEPIDALRRFVAWACPPTDTPDADIPLPFRAGLVGTFGYEMLHFIENVPPAAPGDDIDVADCCLMLIDTVLAHDHQADRSYICALGAGDTHADAKAQADAKIDVLRERIARFEANPPAKPAIVPTVKAPTGVYFDRTTYAELVQEGIDHIAAGDVFEICLTHRLQRRFAGDPWALYCHLRRINPAPFAAYLHMPNADVLCASPERFVKLDRDGWVEARPIKGTRPRGATPADDAKLHAELAASEKDRAENAMIVDLLRNDLGRVCRFGTVEVAEAMAVETYATVFQMVSTIRGQLAPGRDAIELLKACFPGGSMTGAPKVEAMKTISRHEPVTRGIYSGAIGYIDVRGAMDLNIVIRTIVLQAGQAYVNVGGAVVADSDPVGEYDETMHKARALLAALDGREIGNAAEERQEIR